jgi:NTE family protein
MTRPDGVALVLSGGGARGFAHIGVLQALEARGVRIDAVAGTSMGAILGALVAAGKDAEEIYALTAKLGWRDVIDVSLQAGLLKGEKLRSFLAAHLPERFDQLALPLAITTTDLESGEEHVILDGPLVDAVRASSSYPGAFEPVEVDGRTLADGGIVNNLPVAAAALLGCEYVLASDATPPRRSHALLDDADGGSWWERMLATVRLERRSPMAQMLLRSTDVMQAILTDLQYTLHPADVRIVLDMPQYRIESFREFREIVATGREVAERTLDRLAEDRPEALPPRRASPSGGRTGAASRPR